MTDDATTERLRHFLRAVYGHQLYALLCGKQTITNIPLERLPMLLASILIHHAGGLYPAVLAVHEAARELARIEGRGT